MKRTHQLLHIINKLPNKFKLTDVEKAVKNRKTDFPTQYVRCFLSYLKKTGKLKAPVPFKFINEPGIYKIKNLNKRKSDKFNEKIKTITLLLKQYNKNFTNADIYLLFKKEYPDIKINRVALNRLIYGNYPLVTSK